MSRRDTRSSRGVKTLLFGAGLGLAILSSPVLAAGPKGDPVHGQQIFARCAACHTLGQSGGKMGPSLNGVYGRKSGTLAGYTYSPAMKASGLTWTSPTLEHFLAAPMKAVPGTKMFFPGLPAPQDQADVVAYLKQYRADGTKK
jgi:cytochrome c